jgi:hypothetical protein
MPNIKDAMDACTTAGCGIEIEKHHSGKLLMIGATFGPHLLTSCCASAADETIDAAGFDHFVADLKDPKTWASSGLMMPAPEAA